VDAEGIFSKLRQKIIDDDLIYLEVVMINGIFNIQG